MACSSYFYTAILYLHIKNVNFYHMTLYYHRNKVPSSWQTYSGMRDQIKFDNVQNRKVKTIIPHPQYNQMSNDYDVALLELSEPLEFTNTIQPICLPDSSHIFLAGMSCWVTGWGAVREGGIVNWRFFVELFLFIYVCLVFTLGQCVTQSTFFLVCLSNTHQN